MNKNNTEKINISSKIPSNLHWVILIIIDTKNPIERKASIEGARRLADFLVKFSRFLDIMARHSKCTQIASHAIYTPCPARNASHQSSEQALDILGRLVECAF